MIKRIIKHLKDWFEEYDDYSIPNEDFNKSDITNGESNESTKSNEVTIETDEPIIDVSSDDIITYKEENGIVYAYFNKKALDIVLFNRAKERTHNFKDCESWKRPIMLKDLCNINAAISFNPYEDGDFIFKDNLIIVLGLNTNELSRFCSTNNISLHETWLEHGIRLFSKFEGYLTSNIIVNSKSDSTSTNIKNEDILFTIKLATKPEDKFFSKREVFFSYNLLFKEFLNEIPDLNRITSTNEWHVEDYSIVKKGDDILDVFDAGYEAKYCATIKSPCSGLIVRKNVFIVDLLKKGDLLFTIYSNEDCLKDKYPNKLIVTRDDFTNTFHIRGIQCAGHGSGFDLNDIYINFENIAGINYLLVRYNRKNINLNKKCSLHLLLSDSTVIVLNPAANPVKHDSTESVIKFQICQDDLYKLETEYFAKWQIINEDGIILKSGNNTCCLQDYNGPAILKRLSYIIFQNFIKDFNKAIKDNVPEDVSINVIDKSTKGKSTCYVYLMIDTSNNFHKIGISNSPKYREHTLQSDKPTIELLCAKEYPSRAIAEAIESALHNTYASKRIRGEWFKLSPSDIDELKITLS